MMKVTIIGAGRIGTMFSRLSDFDVELVLLRRGETDILDSGPIIVCTRNNDLQTVLSFIPINRRRDLIFVQNGMLQSWLVDHNLHDVSQALLYVAVSTIGQDPVDGQRSVVTGPQSEMFKWIMQTLDLSCTIVNKETYTNEMVEKYLWNCTFGLLCQVYDCSVGRLVQERKIEIETLTVELLQICEIELQFSLSTPERKDLIERLCAYSRSIFDYKGAVKEWDWRNGWLIKTQKPQIVHMNYLEKAVPHWRTL